MFDSFVARDSGARYFVLVWRASAVGLSPPCASSEQSDRGVSDLILPSCRGLERLARSARAEEVEEPLLLWTPAVARGWVARARTDRRGDILRL